MDKNDNTNPQLEAYLENQLSPEEKKNFELELAQNPALSLEWQQYRRVYAALKVFRHNDLVKEVQNLATQSPRLTRRQAVGWVSGIAAGLLVLILSVYGFAQTYSNEAIFKRTFSPYPPLYGTLRSQTSDDLPVFIQGIEVYAEKKYEEAASIFRTIPAENIFYEDGLLFLANSLIAQNQYQEAIEVLSKSPRQTPQVSWYKGLALLAAGETDSAQKTFEALIQNPEDDFYQKKSAIVLEDIHSPLRKLVRQ